MSENMRLFLGCLGAILLSILIFVLAAAINNCGKEDDENNVCSSCGREFTNRDDLNSIAWSSMCEPCNEEYKFKEELYEEAKKIEERYR